MTYEHTSKDTLAIIEADECSQDPRDLTARRFRSCFNEIERLRSALIFIAEIAQEELRYAQVGTGGEVALRHINRRAADALAAELMQRKVANS